MKKLSVILICFLLLVPAFFVPVQAATGNAELVAGAATVQPGGTIEFTAYLENYPQVDSLGITVTVPEGLTVQSGEWLLGGLMADYIVQNGLGVWGSASVVDMSQKVAAFKLVCVLDPNAAESQVSDYEVTVKFNVKASREDQGSAQASATVGRAIPATGLELDKETLSFDLSGTKTAQITATYTPTDTTETLQWSSTNEAVVTVGADGTVTAVAEGTATVVAKIGNLTKVVR